MAESVEEGICCQGIDLVKVFDAILTTRQTREKLQCLDENLISNKTLCERVFGRGRTMGMIL